MEAKHQRVKALESITHSARVYRIYKYGVQRGMVFGQIKLARKLELITEQEAEAIKSWMDLPDGSGEFPTFVLEGKENNDGSTES